MKAYSWPDTLNSELCKMKTAPDSQRRNYCVYRGGSVWTPNKIVLAAYATFRVPHTLRERMLISFLGAFAKLRKQTISFVMSVCPHGTTGLPLDGFSWNFYIWVFFRKCKKKKSVLIKIGKKTTGTLHEDQYTFLITSRSILLRMRNVSDNSRTGNFV